MRNVNVDSVFQKLQHTNTSTLIQVPTLYRCINIYKNTVFVCAINIYIHIHTEFVMNTHKHIGVFKSIHILIYASMLMKEMKGGAKKRKTKAKASKEGSRLERKKSRTPT